MSVGKPSDDKVSARFFPGSAQILIIVAAAVVLGCWVVARLTTQSSVVLFTDNLHWTVAYAVAAMVAVIGYRSASGLDRSVRGWFAIGLIGNTIGQILWDIQVAIDWNPFPGPSDFFYVSLGPCCCVGLLRTMHGRLSPGDRRATMLDIIGWSVAAITVILALYLPRRGDSTLFVTSMLVAYPVFLLTALGIGVVAVLTLRIRPEPATWIFLLAVLANGLLWMEWNTRTLDNTLSNGSWLGYGFSVANLVLGAASAHWQSAPSMHVQYGRWCFMQLRLLPLVLVVASVVTATVSTGSSPTVDATVAVGAGMVVVISMARQSLLLNERDRLLLAERQLRKSEDNLRQSEMRMSGIIGNITDCVFLIDILADEFYFADMNIAVEEQLGLTPQQLIGRRLHECFAHDVADGFVNNYRRCVAAGRVIEYEETIAGPVSPMCFHTVLSPIRDAEGRIHRILGVARNITAQHAAAETMQRLNGELEQRVSERTTELQAANHELAAFAHSVSHDLRAPLRSIDGFSLALLEEYGDRLDGEGRRYLDVVRQQTRHMGGLIDDMLKLSQVTRSPMKRMPIDLSRMAADIIGDLNRQQPGRRVEVVIAPDLHCEADDGLLRIALQNLIGNAWKFSGKCEVARIEVGTGADVQGQAFFVRDNGAGFDMAHVDKLFTAFQRLHSQAEFDGTGIGLATVARVITRHGGRIWAESTPNQGATFWFIIPDRSATPPARLRIERPSPA